MERGMIAALVLVGLGACYPDFHFGPGSGGADATSSSGSSMSSSSTGPTGSSHSSTAVSSSSVASSSSTGTPMPGPPCLSAGDTCTSDQACCFDTVGTSDTCNTGTTGQFNCAGNHLTLECTDDSMCGGLSCCVFYNGSIPFNLLGTECRSDCSLLTTYQACDPTNPACTCSPLLDSYYVSGSAPAPYDQYGQCN